MLHDFRAIASRLQNALETSAKFTATSKKTGRVGVETFRPRLRKPVIDEIDTVLAKHNGFSGEEVDVIINYDIKYRLGAEPEEKD